MINVCGGLWYTLQQSKIYKGLVVINELYKKNIIFYIIFIYMDIFDWEFYIDFNSDIIQIFGNTQESALSHYKNYGSLENRITNENILYKSYPLMKHFDTDYYLENNPDLIQLSKFQLIKHYLIQGYSENRKINIFSSIFTYFNFDNNIIIKYNKYPLISIIIPIYNRSNLIVQCIQSLLNQSYTNLEIIIINDNSTDNTLDQLKQFLSNDKIIILSNNENYGCYTSINLAINMASGEYITIHGSDDFSLHNRFEILMNTMLENNLLMCGNYILRSHFSSFDNLDINNNKNIFNNIIIQNLINQQHNSECCRAMVSLGTLIYHRSVIEIIGEFEFIRKGGDMVFFEKFLYHYNNIKFEKNDCSHRYLTKYNSGPSYKIIEEILYICSELDSNNLTSQAIKFDINLFRDILYNDID